MVRKRRKKGSVVLEDEYAIVARAKKGDRKAFEQLYRMYERFMFSMARSYQRRDSRARIMRVEDHVQNAVFGLYHAVDKFDPRRGVRFLTYAAFWMRSHMQRRLEKFGPVVRVPENTLSVIRDIARMKQQLELEGEIPTPALIAQRLSHTEAYVSAIAARSFGIDSLHAPIRGTDLSLGEVLTVEMSDALDHVLLGELIERMNVALKALSTEEYAVIFLRYQYDLTYAEVGHALASFRADREGVSREMARQIELRALAKLRKLLKK